LGREKLKIDAIVLGHHRELLALQHRQLEHAASQETKQPKRSGRQDGSTPGKGPEPHTVATVHHDRMSFTGFLALLSARV
jgi:hypothetical protein